MRVNGSSRNGKTPAPGSASRVEHTYERFGQRGGRWIALAMAAAASVAWAPSAAADFAADLRQAVTQARDGASCGPLRLEPLVDQTAAIAVRSTDTYLDHNARVAPGRVNQQGLLEQDPLPIMKDLGVNAGKAKLLQGAGRTEAEAIKVILITGYKDLPDCSYTEYGTSTLPNRNLGGWFLTAVVLAGP